MSRGDIFLDQSLPLINRYRKWFEISLNVRTHPFGVVFGVFDVIFCNVLFTFNNVAVIASTRQHELHVIRCYPPDEINRRRQQKNYECELDALNFHQNEKQWCIFSTEKSIIRNNEEKSRHFTFRTNDVSLNIMRWTSNNWILTTAYTIICDVHNNKYIE